MSDHDSNHDTPPHPPPHPMTALRKTEQITPCLICRQPTYYVCSSCSGGDAYCSPQHILQGWTEHSAHCDRSQIISGENAAALSQAIAAQRDVECPTSTGLEANPWIYAGPPPYSEGNTDQNHAAVGLYANPTRGSLAQVLVPLVVTNNVDGSGMSGRAAAVADFIDEPIAMTTVGFGDDLKPRESPLLIIFPMNEYLWGQEVNLCIAKLTKDREGTLPWYGPVLIMKLSEHSPYDFGNMNSGDKKDIEGYFARFR
ncbi:hypothetical protein K466DRAFT_571170 [Polyporus arcularius HHB13444]|uniref:MYND-type domain-containing protein n=1 Tax=Polyporus arcularius HHB13444 TaxID=1314778 RepID=A0A5C3NWP2_9APHY|nr:hypothetical protein K466DRAFT_571170 [Polyporus arcularius HHB13444]